GGRLEATAAAREDGFRLWSHDMEEEWVMVTQLRAGRQQRQRRRQRLWLVMAATTGKRLGRTGSDSYSGEEQRWPTEEEATEGRKDREGLGCNEEGLATTEAVGKRRRQWGPARAAVAGEQRGPTRKRGRKVRRVRLEQRPRRGMADWKRLRLWLRRRGDGGREEKEVAGSGEGCDSERAAGSGEEAREESEEGAAGVAVGEEEDEGSNWGPVMDASSRGVDDGLG
ncbi:hypothetical protein B296_00015563, partial [Ensete ventricosum]